MNSKAFEIRDRMTFIPAVGVLMVPKVNCGMLAGVSEEEQAEAERYLLGRAGFGANSGALVLLVRMDAHGGANQASYDPFGWGCSRTMRVAHEHIARHWNELESGAVICVEHILGERETPKQSNHGRGQCNMSKLKDYLGDSVYADFDGFGVVLTKGPSNTIVLEPEVLAALNRYYARVTAERNTPKKIERTQ